ncbi:hypothetical protein SDRG_08237 [Saprolegnia diclina VS20]|uniref:Inositol polyphosphate-related phosphatase domain-containing protein n=1 Tax=Saprolegnia diclina (strain VS20) TaxID=1156394 RepID=T0QH19_SAPDV|nr:hypothetical protein SDRG_08237 [Saprolegnia diclina VS20]EQC34021.1 hypothetical protein SDRG_08237 [Saprolegnia diclina VS20]|eukprot:XP_008612333.1 hypothetical protein SDRG_08237 [Saprolegnia diclina VS20]
MANPCKISPMTDDPTAEIRRKKRTDDALRKKKDERKHAARRRKHEKQQAAATKIQSLVRGAQTRVYISSSIAPAPPEPSVEDKPATPAVDVPRLVLSALCHSADDLHRSQPRSARKLPTSASAKDLSFDRTLASSRDKAPSASRPPSARAITPKSSSRPSSATNLLSRPPSALTLASGSRPPSARDATPPAQKEATDGDASSPPSSALATPRSDAVSPKLESAATRVQAYFRGYSVRKNQVGIAPPSDDDDDDDEAPPAEFIPDTERPSDAKAAEEDPPTPWPSPLTLESSLDVSQDTTESVLAAGSVRVLVLTWNLQAHKPPPDLSPLLRPGTCHIYAIGTEECVQTIAKSVLFQSKKEWEDKIRATLGPTDYIKLRSHALTAMHNMVFVHKSVLSLVTSLESDAIATGIGNQLGNKGGVGIGFQLGLTRFAFINAHFEAHQSQHALKRRNANFAKINAELRLLPVAYYETSRCDDRVGPISDVFDRVFWSGDLNYRIDGTRRMIETLLARDMHNVLLANDQLTKERDAQRVFQRFHEGPLHFRPTYKFDKGSDAYDTSAKQRIPSWTDRILYATLQPNTIQLRSYESHTEIRTSDHRPVSAVFDVAFAGHEPQLHAAAKSNQTKSEVCSVQ